jgi:hypothetical protein
MFLTEIRNIEKSKNNRIDKYELEYENFKNDIRDFVRKYSNNNIIINYTDYNKYNKTFLLYIKKRLEYEGFIVDISIRGTVRIKID